MGMWGRRVPILRLRLSIGNISQFAMFGVLLTAVGLPAGAPAGSRAAGPAPRGTPRGAGANGLPADRPGVEVRRQVRLMGTACTISGTAQTRHGGLAALEAAFTAIRRVEGTLSTWRLDSALSRLNRAPVGRPVPVEAELAALLGRARHLWEATGRAFDPAVGRLIRAWDLRGDGCVPRPAELEAARKASGLHLVTLDPSRRTATRLAPGAILDAGGFGKGAGLVAASATLDGTGLRRWMIDFGGQVVVSSDEPARVAVADPRRRDRPAAWLRLSGDSAATSSNSERGISVPGGRIGHILDPRTGRPAHDFGSVTAVSADPLEADALSTALFVLGPEDGLRLAEGWAGLEALFLTERHGQLEASWTGGLNGRLELADTVFAGARGGPAAAAAGAEEQRGPDPLEERLRELERQVEALREEVRRGRGEVLVPDRRLDELQRRIEILSREIETLRIGEAAVEADESRHGLGPAAAKVYKTGQGVSLGGYGELLYENFDSRRDDGQPSDKRDRLDLLRAIAYLGYKFNDRILFNSEIEFEHASTSEEGEVSVEFAYLDFRLTDRIGARAGLLLLPMGFINELHEPPVFLGARRPDVERLLIPTTWRENGAGVFGDWGPVSYRAYVVGGFDGAGLGVAGFSAQGLRGGRQKGSKALAEDLAAVARLDWEVVPGLTLGGSLYTGDAGQGAVAPATMRTIDARTDIHEAHVDWRWRGLEARGLWVEVEVEDAGLINDFQDPNRITDNPAAAVGERMAGHYLQVGFDVLSYQGTEHALVPYVRYEAYDTQDEVPAGFNRNPANDVELWTLGFAYRPLSSVILKVDYQDYATADRTGVDQWNVSVGWLF